MNQARTDSIYWDEETKRLVQELAEEDRRSLSQEICWLVHQEWKRRREYQITQESIVEARA